MSQWASSVLCRLHRPEAAPLRPMASAGMDDRLHGRAAPRGAGAHRPWEYRSALPLSSPRDNSIKHAKIYKVIYQKDSLYSSVTCLALWGGKKRKKIVSSKCFEGVSRLKPNEG